MKRAFQFRRTTLLTILLIAFLVGLACGRRWQSTSNTLISLATIWLLISVIFRQIFLFSFCLILGFCVGWWRGATFFERLNIYEQLYDHLVTVHVTAKTDGIYITGASLAFDGGEVVFLESGNRAPPGVIKVETLGVPMIFRGDRLEVIGKLYPAGGSKQGSIKFARASILSRNTSWLEKSRLKFNAGMQTALPEPHASLGLGILVGQRSTLPPSISEQLSRVGLTHIIAVSGYNLTIIVQFIGKKFGKSKYQTLTISILFVVAFILVTGFSASIVRAGLVSFLGLGAWYYGRVMKPLLLLLVSGAISAGYYPVYLWSDIGWYLSFLAFFGVLILAPLMARFFWGSKQPGKLLSLVLESSCAQLMTAPLIMYIFQKTSLIALLSNVIVVPLVPLAMLFSLVAGLTSSIVPVLAAWIAWPARILLTYMLEMIGLMARLPHAVVSQSLSLLLMIAIYGMICIFCGLLWMKTKPKYDKITDETQIIRE